MTSMAPGSSPGGSGFFLFQAVSTSLTDPLNLKFSQSFQNQSLSFTSGSFQKLTVVGPLGEGTKTQVQSVCVARVVSCLWNEKLVSAF